MNAAEMADNPQLNEYLLKDINIDPSLPFEDESFDAVVITVSVQYLTQPVIVFSEVSRILRPGGVFIVTFSNRCFPHQGGARLAFHQRRGPHRAGGLSTCSTPAVSTACAAASPTPTWPRRATRCSPCTPTKRLAAETTLGR